MIQTFRDGATEDLFHRRPTGWPKVVKKGGARKLKILDAAKDFRDLRVPPGNMLEKLQGNRKGQHSIRINDQWRICFNWRSGSAYNVEITDYHD